MECINTCKAGVCLTCNGCSRHCRCPKNTVQRRSRRTGSTQHNNYCGMDEDAAPQSSLATGAAPQSSLATGATPTVLGIKRALAIPESESKNLPSKKTRTETEFKEFDREERGRLIAFGIKAMNSICATVCPKDPDGFRQELAFEMTRQINHGHEVTLLENMTTLVNALPERCIQRQVREAPLATTFPNDILSVKFGIGEGRARKKRQCFKFMVSERTMLKLPHRSSRNYDEKVVQNAVNFVMNDANVQRISWGAHTVTIDGEQRSFPDLIRKRTVRVIARDYVEHFPERKDRVGLTSFEKIVRSISYKDQKAVRAVDYVSGQLLYDNLRMVNRIVDTMENESERLRLRKIVTCLDAHIKGRFEHASHMGQCNHTKPSFSFDRQAMTTHGEPCPICTLIIRVMEYLITQIPEIHHDLLMDCREKLHIYMGHRVRVSNQRSAINDLRSSLDDSEAMIILDFKMKFESKYFREKTSEFYGKKGMTWHGAMVYSRYTEEAKEVAAQAGKQLEPFNITYYDHISTGDSKQDWFAVLSYFEAVIIRMKKDLPHVKRVYVQCDNANCYRTVPLLLGMVLLGINHEVEVKRDTHSGIQDGKSPLDAHFATAMRHVLLYCNEGHDVVTPVQLVNALRSNGGVRNSVAELVGVNRLEMASYLSKYSAAIADLSMVKNQCDTIFDLANQTLTIFEYSNFGAGNTYSIKSLFENDAVDDGGSVGTHDIVVEEDEDDGDDEDSVEDRLDSIVDTNVVDTNETMGEDDDDDLFINGLQVDEIGRLTKCSINSGSLSNFFPRNQKTHSLESLLVPQDDDVIQCTACFQTFNTTFGLQHHVCDNMVGRKDMMTSVIRYAMTQIDSNHFEIIRAKAEEQPTVFNCVGSDLHVESQSLFSPGWACSRQHGQKYGRKYIEPFKEDIAELFVAGCKDKAHRMGPGRMWSALERRYPNRLDLPALLVFDWLHLQGSLLPGPEGDPS